MIPNKETGQVKMWLTLKCKTKYKKCRDSKTKNI